MFFTCLIIFVHIQQGNAPGKWVLGIEIAMVVYFVLIIYFIINTGEMLAYIVGFVDSENYGLKYAYAYSNLLFSKSD